MRYKLAFPFLLLASAAAVACAVSALMSAPIKVNAANTVAAHWRTIGDELQSQFGSALRDVELNVKVPLQLCAGFGVACAPPVETNMHKPCGKTMKEAANDIANGANDGGGGIGGDWGGSGDSGGSGSNPWEGCFSGTQTGTACTSAGGGAEHCVSTSIPILECPGMG